AGSAVPRAAIPAGPCYSGRWSGYGTAAPQRPAGRRAGPCRPPGHRGSGAARCARRAASGPPGVGPPGDARRPWDPPPLQGRGSGAPTSPLSARRVLDPAPVAGAAQIQAQPAIDLVQRVLLRQAFQTGEELLDLLGDVAGQVLLG